jgi:hypothetical protein
LVYDSELKLYSDLISAYPSILDYGMDGNLDSTLSIISKSGNNQYADERIILFDPSYQNPDFYVWYGTHDYEAIPIQTQKIYDLMIVADHNDSFIDNVMNTGTDLYAYKSVYDYGQYNCISGGGCWDTDACLDGNNRGAGAVCDTWNKTVWLNYMKTNLVTTGLTNGVKEFGVDGWLAVNESLNIFLDGLDIAGVSNDGYFEDSLKELTDYIRITKGKKAMLNTYTNYQNYATYGDSIMKESCVSRWGGTTNNPTYEFENWAIETSRYRFYSSHGIPVYCQAFGPIAGTYIMNDSNGRLTTMKAWDIAYYDFMASKVLGYDYFSYNQPSFDYTNAAEDYMWNYYKYPDVGISLESDMRQIGSDQYCRRYSNGEVCINTTDHSVLYDNNLRINSIEVCGKFQEVSSGEGNDGYIRHELNKNTTMRFDFIEPNTLGAWEATTLCKNLTITWYQPSGYYEMIFWYLDKDGDYTGNDNFNVWKDNNASGVEGRYSAYDQTNNGHPPTTLGQPSSDWTNYALGYNYAYKITINTDKESPVDTIPTSVITRTQTGVDEVSVTFNALRGDWTNLSIEDKLMTVNKPTLYNIYTSQFDILNYLADGTCSGDNPLYTTTIIGGKTWSACKQNGTTTFDVKVLLPEIPVAQTTGYRIDANAIPIINSQDNVLIDLLNGNQNWQLNYSVTEPDSDTIICQVNKTGQIFTGSYSSGYCSVNIVLPLNATSDVFVIPQAIDSYGKTAEGTSEQLTKIDYEGIISNYDSVGYSSVQYFYKTYLIPISENINNIQWNIIGNPVQTVNLQTPFTTLQVEYTNDAMKDETIGVSGTTFYVDNLGGVGDVMNLNIMINNTAGVILPDFWVEYTLPYYYTGTPSINYTNGTFVSFIGTNIVRMNISGLEIGEVKALSIRYLGTAFKSTEPIGPVSNVLTVVGTNLKNYTFYREITTPFATLITNSTILYNNIPYSMLTDWANRTVGTESITYVKDQSNNSLSLCGTNYCYTDLIDIDNVTPVEQSIKTETGDTSYIFEMQYKLTSVWSCDGYAACMSNNTQNCNHVIDLENRGETYTGDYSEFAAQACVYNTAPNKPQITLPVNNSAIASNTVDTVSILVYTTSNDTDNDTLRTEFYVGTTNPPTTLKQNTTTKTYNFVPGVVGTYYARVKTYDGIAYSDWSDVIIFTVSSSANTGGTGEASTPTTCDAFWACSEYSLCSNSIQTRTCIDLNACGTATTPPIMTKSCSVLDDIFSRPARWIDTVCVDMPLLDTTIYKYKTNTGITSTDLGKALNKWKTIEDC